MILTREELQALWQENIEEYRGEIRIPWPKMNDDMAWMRVIISDQASQAEGKVTLFENLKVTDDCITLKLPDWWKMVQIYFQEKYGEKLGQVIMEKALVRLADEKLV